MKNAARPVEAVDEEEASLSASEEMRLDVASAQRLRKRLAELTTIFAAFRALFAAPTPFFLAKIALCWCRAALAKTHPNVGIISGGESCNVSRDLQGKFCVL